MIGRNTISKDGKLKKLSNVPPMSNKELAEVWDEHQPEKFKGWQEGDLNFKQLPKKLIQLRLDPGDVRIIDRESKRSGIDRAQLVRFWVKEKIGLLDNA